MIPFLSRLRREALTLLAIGACLVGPPLGADETVKLKDGSTHRVKTTFGRPDTFSDKNLLIEQWGAVVRRTEVNGPSDLLWQITLLVRKDGYGRLTARSPELPGFLLDGFISAFHTGTPDGGNLFRVGEEHTFTAAPRSLQPECWTWLEQPGVSWIPFECSYTWNQGFPSDKAMDPVTPFKASGLPVTRFTQWVRFTEEKKHELREAFRAIQAKEAKRLETVTVRDPEGAPSTLELWDGMPRRRWNRPLIVQALSPFFTLPDAGGTRHFGWELDATCRLPGKTKITLSSPWHPDRKPDDLEVGGFQSFKGVVFLRKNSPWMWEWLGEQGRSFVPVRIKVESEFLATPEEWTEWALIPSEAKERIRSLLQQEEKKPAPGAP